MCVYKNGVYHPWSRFHHISTFWTFGHLYNIVYVLTGEALLCSNRSIYIICWCCKNLHNAPIHLDRTAAPFKAPGPAESRTHTHKLPQVWTLTLFPWYIYKWKRKTEKKSDWKRNFKKYLIYESKLRVSHLLALTNWVKTDGNRNSEVCNGCARTDSPPDLNSESKCQQVIKPLQQQKEILQIMFSCRMISSRLNQQASFCTWHTVSVWGCQTRLFWHITLCVTQWEKSPLSASASDALAFNLPTM